MKKLICVECGRECEEVEICEKIADFQFGRPATQHHYYKGSDCCGGDVEEVPEDEEDSD